MKLSPCLIFSSDDSEMSSSCVHRLFQALRRGRISNLAWNMTSEHAVRHLTDMTERQTKGETVENVCQAWTEVLEKHGVAEPRVSVEYIVAHVLRRKTMHNIAGFRKLNQQQMKTVNAMCHQRLQHKPVQYILGEWDFHDIELKLHPPVFIPRPETEQLAELSIQMLNSRQLHAGRLLELCCGSGAITLSVLNKCPQLCGVAVDVSPEACSLTEENAHRLGLVDRITVIAGDLTDSAVQETLRDLGPFDLLVSNPPYVPTDLMASLDPHILQYEDHRALDGGVDGLDVVRQILHLSPLLLHPDRDILLEIQPGQPKVIHNIVSSMRPSTLQYISSHRDYIGKERFCHLRTVNSLLSEQHT